MKQSLFKDISFNCWFDFSLTGGLLKSGRPFLFIGSVIGFILVLTKLLNVMQCIYYCCIYNISAVQN